MSERDVNPNETADRAVEVAGGLIRDNRIAEARGLVDAVLAVDPNHADALCLGGIIELRESRLNAAAHRFLRVLDLVPGHEAARFRVLRERLTSREGAYPCNTCALVQ